MNFLSRLLHIDRRWIFLGIALGVVVPYFIPSFKVTGGAVSPRTRSVYDAIEQIKPGGVVLIAYDYGPATTPELQPMALAITRHAMSRGLRVLGVCLVPEGTLLAQQTLTEAGKQYNKQEGVDYVNLGFKPNSIAVIKGIGADIYKVFPSDFNNTPTKSLAVMRGVHTYKDIGIVIPLSGTPLPGTWIAFAHEAYGATVGIGVTAVMATDFQPYVQSNQIVGLISGMKGASEYESLIGQPGAGMAGMSAQSVAHLWIIFTVILGNIAFFAWRARGGR
jgi:hypothetical protein